MLPQCRQYLSRSRTRRARGGLACLLTEPCLVICSTFSYAASCTPWHGAMFTGCTCPAAYRGPEPRRVQLGPGPGLVLQFFPSVNCCCLCRRITRPSRGSLARMRYMYPDLFHLFSYQNQRKPFCPPGEKKIIKPSLLEQLPVRSAHLLQVMKLRKPCGDYS